MQKKRFVKNKRMHVFTFYPRITTSNGQPFWASGKLVIGNNYLLGALNWSTVNDTIPWCGTFNGVANWKSRNVKV